MSDYLLVVWFYMLAISPYVETALSCSFSVTLAVLAIGIAQRLRERGSAWRAPLVWPMRGLGICFGLEALTCPLWLVIERAANAGSEYLQYALWASNVVMLIASAEKLLLVWIGWQCLRWLRRTAAVPAA